MATGNVAHCMLLKLKVILFYFTLYSSSKFILSMPTVLALDVSLSMGRPVKTDSPDDFNRKNLAIHGISTLLDHFTTNCKLEFTSLVSKSLRSLA